LIATIFSVDGDGSFPDIGQHRIRSGNSVHQRCSTFWLGNKPMFF